MFGITDLTTYVIGVVAIIILPGPNSLFCLAVSAKDGIVAGYRTVLGILLGDSLLMLATVFGAGTLLKLYPTLFVTIKIIGGLYLAYLGFGLIRASFFKWQHRHQINQSQQLTNTRHPFWRSLMLSLTNPKAILFFLSFFVQFVSPSYPHPLTTFLALAVILQIISFLYLSLLVFAGKQLANTFAKKRTLSSIAMGLVGLLFMSFAVNLWLSQL